MEGDGDFAQIRQMKAGVIQSVNSPPSQFVVQVYRQHHSSVTLYKFCTS